MTKIEQAKEHLQTIIGLIASLDADDASDVDAAQAAVNAERAHLKIIFEGPGGVETFQAVAEDLRAAQAAMYMLLPRHATRDSILLPP